MVKLEQKLNKGREFIKIMDLHYAEPICPICKEIMQTFTKSKVRCIYCDKIFDENKVIWSNFEWLIKEEEQEYNKNLI